MLTISIYVFLLLLIHKLRFKRSTVIMSLTFTLSGNSSTLESQFNPPLYLDDDLNYEIGLCNFESFNVIPNIDETNNKFPYDDAVLTFPTGAYEIQDIIDYLDQNLPRGKLISITPHMHSTTVSLKTNFTIDFSQNGTIASILGFQPRRLEPLIRHMSDFPVQILKVNSISIDCNVATGSYSNGVPSHIIHQFFPSVPPGYKIVESPQNILYFPVSVKAINTLTINIVDQDNNLINFRNEIITLRLHLRSVNHGH